MNIHLKLCRLLSFTSLAAGWIGARILKFYLFDIEGFGFVWTIKPPTLMNELQVFLGTVIGAHALLLLAAIVIDQLVGPIFFREEVAEMETILNTN